MAREESFYSNLKNLQGTWSNKDEVKRSEDHNYLKGINCFTKKQKRYYLAITVSVKLLLISDTYGGHDFISDVCDKS